MNVIQKLIYRCNKHMKHARNNVPLKQFAILLLITTACNVTVQATIQIELSRLAQGLKDTTNAISSKPYSEAFHAVRSGLEIAKTIQKLRDQGYKLLDVRDKNGNTLLHEAVNNQDKIDLMKDILQALTTQELGHMLSAQNADGDTPLHLFSSGPPLSAPRFLDEPPKLDSLKTLMQKINESVANARVQSIFTTYNTEGKNPLQLAAEQSKLKQNMMQTYIDQLPNDALYAALTDNRHGTTALHALAKNESVDKQQLARLKQKLQGDRWKKALKTENSQGKKPSAVSYHQQAGKQWLKDKLLRVADESTLTNAIKQARQGNITGTLVQLIQNHEISPNYAVKPGEKIRIAHVAARQGSKQLLDALIANDVSINEKNKQGETPLDIARNKGHQNIAQAIQNYVQQKQ